MEKGYQQGGCANGYLLSDAIELGQDVEEWHLGDNELLLLIFVEGGGGKVQRQVHKGGLHHCLLVLVIMEQLLFFFCWLEIGEKKKEGRNVNSMETTTDGKKGYFVTFTFTSFYTEVSEEGRRREWAVSCAVAPPGSINARTNELPSSERF